MRRSSGCGPARCGPKGRHGARRGAIWCGATFRTTGRCDGRRTTAASACSARPRTTATATRSTSRAGSSPASISRAAWCATSTTAPSTVIADTYQRQAAQLAERRRAASRRQLLVHRSALWRPALRGRAGCRGRPEQRRRPAQSAHRPACRLRARPPRAADQLLSRRPQRARRPGRQRGAGARSRTGSASRPTTRSSTSSSTGKGPGDTGPGGKGDIHVFDVGTDNKLSNQKLFTDCMVDGVKCGPDGMRCDVNGNLWVSSNAGRAVGYSGVTVWSPEGKLLGRIRLPEVCGNVCFGGPKRNRLFMAASQSLYAVYTATRVRHPAERSRLPERQPLLRRLPPARPRPSAGERAG